MGVETREQVLEKLEQSRRLLQQTSDLTTTDRVRIYIEELEAKLLQIMSQGPKE